MNIIHKQSDITFNGTGIDGTKMRKAFYGITCPCCGIKMLGTKDIGNLLKLSTDTPSEKIIPVLDKYKNRLHPVEKDVFYTLKALSIDNPKANLRELLNQERAYCLQLLHDDEMKIIERIRQIAQFLSAKSMQTLEQLLKTEEKLISKPDLSSTFKRRVFIAKIADVLSKLKEKEVCKTIFDIAHEIPRAGNNKSAFIVKYTEKKPSTGIERNSHDILRGMLYPSVATIEHVKVRSSKFRYGGGKNESGNYILECQRDNNLRDSMPFAEFVKSNPKFFGSKLQQYIDFIIEKLNRGELKGFEDYPLKISRTLRRQSKGLIKIDISKYKN